MRISTFLSAAFLVASVAAAPTVLNIAITMDDGASNGPFTYTSTFNVVAVGAEVTSNANEPAPGAPEATGFFNYGLNSELDTICYVSTLSFIIRHLLLP